METLITRYVNEIARLQTFLKSYNNTGSQSCAYTIARTNTQLEAYYGIVKDLESIQNKKNLQAMCCLGKEHNCPLNVNNGFCRAKRCQYRVEEILD